MYLRSDNFAQDARVTTSLGSRKRNKWEMDWSSSTSGGCQLEMQGAGPEKDWFS